MVLIREMPEAERPRAKALKYGIRTLSNKELLAVILRTGSKGISAEDTAEILLQKAGSIARLSRMDISEFVSVKGISEVKALQLISCFELSRRSSLESTENIDVMNEPSCLAEWLKKEIGSSMQEKFLAVYLNKAMQIIGYRTLFVGTVDMSGVYPREIFREALLMNSTDIILVHNHPSGILTPSENDLYLTKRLIKAGMIMGVKVLDHLIITQSGWLSFHMQGIMEDCVEGSVKD